MPAQSTRMIVAQGAGSSLRSVLQRRVLWHGLERGGGLPTHAHTQQRNNARRPLVRRGEHSDRERSRRRYDEEGRSGGSRGYDDERRDDRRGGSRYREERDRERGYYDRERGRDDRERRRDDRRDRDRSYERCVLGGQAGEVWVLAGCWWRWARVGPGGALGWIRCQCVPITTQSAPRSEPSDVPLCA